MKPRPDYAFPIEAIPQPLRGMALALSHRYAVAPSVVIMAMLGALGAAVGNQIEFVPWPGHTVPGCLNVLFPGPTSPVVDAVWAPLLAAQQAQVEWLFGLDAADFGTSVPCVSAGSVSVMMVASPADANRLLTDPWAVRSGLAATFLVVRDSQPSALDEFVASAADQWADWVQRLFSWRHAGTTMMSRPTPEAQGALDSLARELTSLTRLPEPHRHLAGSWPQQALRLTLLLHLGTGNPQALVAAETVQAALALTRWLIDQQADLLAQPADLQADRLEEFVRGLVPTAGTWLTVTQSYDTFAQQCRQFGIKTPSRKDYTGRVTDLIDQIHGIRLRKDVPGLNGKNQTGWAGIELAETATEGINDSARLPVLPVLPAAQPADQIEFLI